MPNDYSKKTGTAQHCRSPRPFVAEGDGRGNEIIKRKGKYIWKTMV